MHISMLLMEQIVELFIMIFMGFAIVKAGIVKDEESKVLSKIVLYLVIPCVIVNAFQVDYTAQTVKGLMIAFVASVILQIILLIIVAVMGKVLSLKILSCSISDGEWADVSENQEKMKLKEKIFNIIQIGDKSNRISRMFDIFITVTIVANILVTFLQTFDELAFLAALFKGVEYVTIFIFCVEYILRIWTAEYLYPDKSRGRSRLRFLVSFDGIVDLLTIVPVFFLSGFVIFRMLRVARIFHLFRLNAKYDSFNVITTVLYEKRNQIISSVFIVLILMLASSLCMYSVEHDAQPTVFRNAFSGIWWSMSTLLTVGYGDIYPITPLGRVMAICIAYLGVGVVAIPTGIISAGFVEQYQRKSNISGLKNEDIKEIAEVFVDKKYAGKTVQDMEEANQLTVFLILREDFSILPQKDTILRMNDIIVIRDENENS